MREAKPETGDTPEPQPPQKRRRFLRLLIFASPLILAAVAAGAAYMFVPHLGERARALVGWHPKPAAIVSSQPQFIDLPEMAVTLPNGGHPRQMRIHLSVELATTAPPNATAQVLSPPVYDALVTYLRTLRDGEVDGGLGLDRLRGDLYRRLDLVLGPGVLRDVLITSLILA